MDTFRDSTKVVVGSRIPSILSVFYRRGRWIPYPSPGPLIFFLHIQCGPFRYLFQKTSGSSAGLIFSLTSTFGSGCSYICLPQILSYTGSSGVNLKPVILCLLGWQPGHSPLPSKTQMISNNVNAPTSTFKYCSYLRLDDADVVLRLAY